jgi:hypothetical protein
MDELVVTEEAWPYGLRCMDCNTKMKDGTAYSKRLVGITGPAEEDDPSDYGSPVVEIVCVPWGLGLTSDR